MAEKISPLIALLERRNLELAKLKERIAAQPDIVYCRECKKRHTRICPLYAAGKCCGEN